MSRDRHMDRATCGRLWPRLASVLRHRLVHFVLAGALLATAAPKERDARVITLDPARLDDALRAEQARTGRSLSASETERVKKELVDDEILAREALRLGVATEDPVVRARLAQEMRRRVGGDRGRTPGDSGPRRRLAVWYAPTEREAAAIAQSIRAVGKERARGLGARPPIPDGAVWSEKDLASVAGTSASRAAFEGTLGEATGAIASAWGFYVFVTLEEVPAAPAPPRTDDAEIERFTRRARADYRIEGVD